MLPLFKKLSNPNQLTIYTDGCCKPNPGRGVWAWIALNQSGEVVAQKFGVEEKTTNNRMELTAILAAIMAHPEAAIVSDSTYCARGLSKLEKWAANGWVKDYQELYIGVPTFKEVANRDLWESILEEKKKNPIRISWVKGHAHTKGNILVDRLCSSVLGGIQ